MHWADWLVRLQAPAGPSRRLIQAATNINACMPACTHAWRQASCTHPLMQVALPCCIQLCARLWLVLPLQPSAHGSSDVTGSWLAAGSRVVQLALEQEFFTPSVALRCIGSQPGRQQVTGRQPLSRTAAAGQRLRQLACFTAIFSCCASTAFLLCNTCKGISRNSRMDTLQTTGTGDQGWLDLLPLWLAAVAGWVHPSVRQGSQAISVLRRLPGPQGSPGVPHRRAGAGASVLQYQVDEAAFASGIDGKRPEDTWGDCAAAAAPAAARACTMCAAESLQALAAKMIPGGLVRHCCSSCCCRCEGGFC